jgi:hypothetical protein
MVASTYPFMNVMWSMFVFFAWVIWIWLLFAVFADLFRRHDVSGWGKAGWTVFVIVLPYIGVLTYLVTQGSQMAERSSDRSTYGAEGDYGRAAPSGGTASAQIAQGKQLLDSGAITASEFDTLKQKALAGA